MIDMTDAGLAVALGVAAATDLRMRIIPDSVPVAVLLLFGVKAMLGDAPAWPWHLAAGGGAFVICLGLFARGWMGGGDAKLIPAMAVWAGPDRLAMFLLAMTLAGGLLALFMLIRRRLSAAGGDAAAEPAGDDAAREIPYALAIAAGGAVLLWRDWADAAV